MELWSSSVYFLWLSSALLSPSQSGNIANVNKKCLQEDFLIPSHRSSCLVWEFLYNGLLVSTESIKTRWYVGLSIGIHSVTEKKKKARQIILARLFSALSVKLWKWPPQKESCRHSWIINWPVVCDWWDRFLCWCALWPESQPGSISECV